MREDTRQHEGTLNLGSISEHTYQALLSYTQQRKSS